MSVCPQCSTLYQALNMGKIKVNFLVIGIAVLLPCLFSSVGKVSAQEGNRLQKVYQVLYQHTYTLEGTYRALQCDTTELLVTPTASRYGVWYRDELLAELKAEKAGVQAAKPKSIVTLMSIEMLRSTLEQAGIDFHLKYLRPWFVTKETELIYKRAGIDSLRLLDELPKDGLISYSKPKVQYEWLESDETEQVLGYLCKKATATVEGKRWTAWYSEELPFDNGPAEFSGLPGLILRLSDDKGAEYRAIGFKQIQIPSDAISLPLKAKVLKERDYQDLRTSDRNNRRYYLFGGDGNIYFVYMDRDGYLKLLEDEK